MSVCTRSVVTLRLRVLAFTINDFNGSCGFKLLLKKELGFLSV